MTNGHFLKKMAVVTIHRSGHCWQWNWQPWQPAAPTAVKLFFSAARYAHSCIESRGLRPRWNVRAHCGRHRALARAHALARPLHTPWRAPPRLPAATLAPPQRTSSSRGSPVLMRRRPYFRRFLLIGILLRLLRDGKLLVSLTATLSLLVPFW